MIFSARIRAAINRASILHKGQVRKSGRMPYIVHPFSVALLLNSHGASEDVIIAGLLHDALEDCPGYTREELAHEFGQRVAAIVEELSHDRSLVEEKGLRATWYERKTAYLAHLNRASRAALLICCADKIHNLFSMVDSYAMEGEKMWRAFHSPSDRRFWFYEEVLDIMQRRLKHPIVRELEVAVAKAKKILKAK